MYNNTIIIKSFIKKNVYILIAYIIIICIILPVESIGISEYTSKILNAIKNDNINNIDVIKTSVMIICAIYFGTQVLHGIQNYIEIHINSNLTYQLRHYIFTAFISKYNEHYKEAELGRVISMLNIIPHIYEDMIYDLFHTLLPYGFTILVLLGYFCYINIYFGLFLLLMFCIFIICIYVMARQSIIANVLKYNSYYKLNDNIQDKMTNIHNIIMNNELNNEIKQNNDVELDYKSINLSYEKLNVSHSIKINILLLIILVISMLIFYYLFKNKKLHHTKFVSAFMVFFYLLRYLNNIKWNLLDFINKYGTLESIKKYFDNNQPIFKGGTERNFLTNGDIIISNLTFKYDKNNVIENINMEFKNNTITAIYGPSGSGKTTILKLIMGFYPYTGNIIIDDVNLNEIDISYLRDNIAIINQNVNLFNTSIYDNIKYSTDVSNEYIDNMINDLQITNLGDLNKNVGINGSEMSQGQKQIILLLRAFIKNKKILILDEPTSALDASVKEIILNLIKIISKNKTTIIVTHDDDILNITDNVYNLSK